MCKRGTKAISINITNKECYDEMNFFKLVIQGLFLFKTKIPLKQVKPFPVPAKSYTVIAILHDR